MKNKKGFTLVELLTVIVILGIVLTIAVLGFNGIRRRILERQYQNLVTEIKASAELYFKNTEVKEIYVQTLIDDGYFKADDKNGNVYNPINRNIMNCDIITFNDESIGYTPDPNGKCNNIVAPLKDLKLVIINQDGSQSDILDTWYDGSKVVSYMVVKDDVTISNAAKHVWTTNKNPSMNGEKGKYVDLKNHLNNGVFKDYIRLTVEDDNKIYYSDEVQIKIDTRKPEVKGDPEIKTEPGKIIIDVDVIDEGSGVDSYIFTPENDCSNLNWDDAQKLSGNNNEHITITLTEKEYDEYYLCVKDKAGNESDPDDISIVGYEVPEVPKPDVWCEYAGANTTWTTKDVTIKYICGKKNASDNVTLRKQNCDGSYTVNNNQNTQNYKFSKDTHSGKAYGNINIKEFNKMCFECSLSNGTTVSCPSSGQTLNVYVDYANPKIKLNSVKSTSNNFSTNTVKINFNVSDEGSGVNTVKFEVRRKGYSIPIKTIEIDNNDLNDIKNGKAYEYTMELDEYQETPRTYTVTLKAYDKVGNTASSDSMEYTPYVICSVLEDEPIGTAYGSRTCDTDCKDYSPCGNCKKNTYNVYLDKYLNIECNVKTGYIDDGNEGRCSSYEECHPTIDPGTGSSGDGEECTPKGERCYQPPGTDGIIVNIGCCDDNAEYCDGYDRNYLKTNLAYCKNNDSSNPSPSPTPTPSCQIQDKSTGLATCKPNSCCGGTCDATTGYCCRNEGGIIQCTGTDSNRNTKCAFCASDSDCSGDLKCISYKCVEKKLDVLPGGDCHLQYDKCGVCISSDDCKANLTCIKNKCVNQAMELYDGTCGKVVNGGFCTVNTQCYSGICEGNTCKGD